MASLADWGREKKYWERAKARVMEGGGWPVGGGWRGGLDEDSGSWRGMPKPVRYKNPCVSNASSSFFAVSNL